MASERQARLHTLNDAIVEATRALGEIRLGEQITRIDLGEFADGGFYWSIGIVSTREIGNTKTALTPRHEDYSQDNARQLVQAIQNAYAEAATPRTDR